MKSSQFSAHYRDMQWAEVVALHFNKKLTVSLKLCYIHNRENKMIATR